MTANLATLESLVQVRDFLIEAMGDHMVASTIYAKRFPIIYRAIARGETPANVALEQWHTEFAGREGYEK